MHMPTELEEKKNFWDELKNGKARDENQKEVQKKKKRRSKSNNKW